MTSHQVGIQSDEKVKTIGNQGEIINGKKQSSSEEDVSDRIENNDNDDVNKDHHNIATTASNKTDTSQATNEIKRLHPFVHWAQSPSHISLRVDLSQTQDLKVFIEGDTDSCLEFSAKGRGAHGLQEYHFSLEFYSQVDKDIVNTKIERYVLILIKKSSQVSWPRLTKHSSRLPWLRVDFDRYDDSDESDATEDKYSEFDINKAAEQLRLNNSRQSRVDSGDQSDQQQPSSSWASSLDSLFKENKLYKSNFDTFNPFNKRTNKTKTAANMKYDHRKEAATMDNSKNLARNALDYKKTYLFLYNLVMFIMFLKVFIVLVIKGLSGTIDDGVVQGAAFIIKLLTYTQLLETIHPMLGLVPGGPMMPFTQSIGRLVVNYFLTEPIIRLDSAPYAHYLFIVWSSIEIFRYSFYALRVFKVNIYALTWCRYTLFLPLYPMGGLCESMVLLSTIKHYEKTGEHSISLPNAANASFNLPWTLRVYIFVLLGPTIYMLMKYMWGQRCKQLKEKVA